MTQEESKHIDFVFTMAIIASNRDVDKTDILNAVCFDIHQIREGNKPTETKKLVWCKSTTIQIKSLSLEWKP